MCSLSMLERIVEELTCPRFVVQCRLSLKPSQEIVFSPKCREMAPGVSSEDWWGNGGRIGANCTEMSPYGNS